MKKFFVLILTLMLAVSLVGCGANEPAKEEPNTAQGEYEDGIYYAEMAAFDHGIKYFAKLKVTDGKIIEANWDGIPFEGGKLKKQLSTDGEYGMVEKGGAQASWAEQSKKATDYLIETQDPEAINYTDDEGHTDDIAGVSIHVVEFFDLAQEALANGPVSKGEYKDGFYYAEEKEFSHEWKGNANISVVNGTITGVSFNAIPEVAEVDKVAFSKEGNYPMVEQGGAQAPWHEQVAKAEAYLLETQDPTAIEYSDEEGHTDDIAGVTIGVNEFFTLAEEALADAK